MKSSQFHNQLS